MAVEVMDDKKILRAALKERKETQKSLANRMGIQQNALSANMSRNRMGLDNFVNILNMLGYDVIVADRNSGEAVWRVTTD